MIMSTCRSACRATPRRAWWSAQTSWWLGSIGFRAKATRKITSWRRSLSAQGTMARKIFEPCKLRKLQYFIFPAVPTRDSKTTRTPFACWTLQSSTTTQSLRISARWRAPTSTIKTSSSTARKQLFGPSDRWIKDSKSPTTAASWRPTNSLILVASRSGIARFPRARWSLWSSPAKSLQSSLKTSQLPASRRTNQTHRKLSRSSWADQFHRRKRLRRTTLGKFRQFNATNRRTEFSMLKWGRQAEREDIRPSQVSAAIHFEETFLHSRSNALLRSRRMGHFLVHQRPAHPRNQRRSRQDIHVRGRGRQRSQHTRQVSSVLHHERHRGRLRAQIR